MDEIFHPVGTGADERPDGLRDHPSHGGICGPHRLVDRLEIAPPVFGQVVEGEGVGVLENGVERVDKGLSRLDVEVVESRVERAIGVF